MKMFHLNLLCTLVCVSHEECQVFVRYCAFARFASHCNQIYLKNKSYLYCCSCILCDCCHFGCACCCCFCISCTCCCCSFDDAGFALYVPVAAAANAHVLAATPSASHVHSPTNAHMPAVVASVSHVSAEANNAHVTIIDCQLCVDKSTHS